LNVCSELKRVGHVVSPGEPRPQARDTRPEQSHRQGALAGHTHSQYCWPLACATAMEVALCDRHYETFKYIQSNEKMRLKYKNCGHRSKRLRRCAANVQSAKSVRRIMRTSRETQREVALNAVADAMRGGGRAAAAPIKTRRNAICFISVMKNIWLSSRNCVTL
jgi:hypothetical protein